LLLFAMVGMGMDMAKADMVQADTGILGLPVITCTVTETYFLLSVL